MKKLTKQKVKEAINIRMHYEITGCTKARKKQLLREYENIAVVLLEEFSIILDELHWSHVIMYFTDCAGILKLSPGTRYRHWRRWREILTAIGVYDEWKSYIQGNWCNPTGRLKLNKKGAGRKPKYC